MEFTRAAALQRLRDDTFDVLVVGGGITGAGIALDAASRGLRTALVEREDFASGTSSRSSKLVHGGIRYLAQHEFRLVYENLAERRLLLRNAPHLVHPIPFLVPLFGRGGVVDRATARAYASALWIYDLTGGARIGHLHRRVSRDEALAHLPALDTGHLVAGFLYWDAQTDDSRLVLSVLRTAALRFDAACVNHLGVAALRHAGGRLSGAVLDDGSEVRARCVVNATGVWSDAVRGLDDADADPQVRPARGVHVVVPWDRLRCDIAAVVPVRSDRRSLFVMPWGERVYIGTTDSDHPGDLDQPRCTAEEVDYVLEGVNGSLRSPLTRDDVLGTWAGLRPLLSTARTERTADLSRRHTVQTSPSGLVTVTGGKLTTYRRMAADAVDAALNVLGRRARCRTADLPLVGAPPRGTAAPSWPAPGRTPRPAEHLAARYGDEAGDVQALLAARPELAAPLVPGLPYLAAEAVHAVRHEMATGLDDVLARRTRARLLDSAATAMAAAEVALLLAPEVGWRPDEALAQAETYRADVLEERRTAGLRDVAMPAAARAAGA